MTALRLSLSCNEYDRTRFLVDGTVKAEGLDLNIVSLPSEERHRRFSQSLEFDVCELQMGVFLGWMGRDAPFRAIPVFPHRKFCHGNVLVNVASGITRPEDFAGRLIGMRAHFNPVSLWMRGVLEEEHGVPARSLCIRTNQQEQVPGWQPPEWMDYERLPKGQKIEDVLPNGGVDACMLPEIGPRHTRVPGVRRLWPNFREIEKQYYLRTKIFPIRHVVVVKNAILEKNPVGGAKPGERFHRSENGYQARERHAAIISRLVRRRAGRGARAVRRRRLAVQLERQPDRARKNAPLRRDGRDHRAPAGR